MSVMIANKIIKIITHSSVVFVFATFTLFTLTFFYYAMPAISHNGYHFITDMSWQPNSSQYGALSFILTTMASAILAIIIALPLSISIAILLEEYYKKGRFNKFIKYSIDILATVPSIIYGYWFWSYVLPLFTINEMNQSMAISILFISVTLSIMIIPFLASISLNMISKVPDSIKIAAYSLGASKYRMIINVLIPYSSSGLWSGMLVAITRCIGETMALIFILGGSSNFSDTNTMTTIIANDLFTIKDPLHLSALAEIGLLLFFITTLISILSKYFLQKA